MGLDVLGDAASALFGETITGEALAFGDTALRKIVGRRIAGSGAAHIINVDNDDEWRSTFTTDAIHNTDISTLFNEGVKLPRGGVAFADVSFFLRR